MKTIGLIGGMSWQSSAEYYRIMNEEVKHRLGGMHSARILMYSVDFATIHSHMFADDWQSAGRELAEAAKVLEKGGADVIIIGTNTMHIVAPYVEEAVSIPVLHIADATAEAVREQGGAKVGLLGTAFTMEKDFYRGRLAGHGIEVLVPSKADRELVDRVIFDEMCKGIFSDDSRHEYVRIIGELVSKGADLVVLGCTEIGLLVRPEDTDVPLIDTCRVHAVSAVKAAL
ncbi:aspartate/glutamate racemase family protein [uncultured Pseudodesulfovibrio sp.]|uniref:aspartate/glutamate racemase family protein n=1 Tax=uncultured Pseudodesulfovibrio sp. TaxID=2035858 RepID=UPI0029C8916B|nr:aspartate/glutamate racemase family protein [uncultured Pseudodesulfovibrio sp.]